MNEQANFENYAVLVKEINDEELSDLIQSVISDNRDKTIEELVPIAHSLIEKKVNDRIQREIKISSLKKALFESLDIPGNMFDEEIKELEDRLAEFGQWLNAKKTNKINDRSM